MKNRKIIIGSRGSKLALIYAEKAREKILKHLKDFGIEEVIIKEIVTRGDQVQDTRLSEVGGKGLFSKTIFQDDFNSPKAISLLQAYAGDTERGGDVVIEKLCTLKVLLNSLGLLLDETENYFKYGELDLSDEEIKKLISDRKVARENKKFNLADEIRDQLLKKGVVLEDLDGKTTWKKKS